MKNELMKAFVKFLLALLICGGASSSYGQDIHFSQFYMSPMHLNPALTGVMNCNARVTANFRNQWASVLKSNAYNTFSGSYDQKFTSGRYDYFGVGLTMWGDKAGQLDFGVVQAKISGSFSKRLGGYRDKNHYLSVGAEIGISNRSVNLLNSKYGDQFNPSTGGFDPDIETNDLNTFNRNSYVFPDLGAGVLWFSVFGDNNIFAGAAYQHLNSPNQSFDSNGDTVPLFSKLTVHAGGEYALNNKLSLVPGIVWLSQGPSMEINGGTSFKFILNKQLNNAFQTGLWVRLANHVEKSVIMDAVILSTRFDYGQFSLGFSYDLNVSSLSVASNHNGSFEFALQYLLCGPEVRNVYCPSF